MAFLRQVKFEIKNILRSRFLLIIAILTILISILVPVLDYFGQRQYNNGSIGGPEIYASERVTITAATAIYPGNSKDYYRDYGSRGEPITIDGKTVNVNHPLYWNVENMLMEKNMISDNQGQFSSPAVLDLTLQLIDTELNYIMTFTPYITNHSDYRMGMVYNTNNLVHEKFYLENSDLELKVLEEIANHRKTSIDPTTIKTNFKDLSSTERLAALDKVQEQMDQAQKIVIDNDFPLYIDLEIKLQQGQINGLEENIAIQEAAIIANPEQEENLNQIIKELDNQIKNIKTNRIPILEYRLEKMIIPGTSSWQNMALSDLENNRNSITYYLETIKVTEEEWNERQRGGGGAMPLPEPGYPGQNQQTYKDYIAGVQKSIDEANLNIAVAQQSLDTERPDMRYVRDGARSKTNSFLWYSTVIMMFGIMLGGWLIASEHQQGTIRLLMIRPKTRTKILLAKFTGALIVWLAVDLIASFANMLFNGILFGFGDFASPNYTIGGEIGFLAYYLPRLAACALPILFLFTLSFLLSVVVKNTAVSVGLPIVAYVVGFIFLGIFSYRTSPAWLQFTPIPYLQMPSLVGGTDIMGMVRNLSLATGILLLLGYSLVNVVISIIVFKKRDIVN